MYAALYGRHKIVSLLLEARASYSMLDVRGWSALMYGAHRGDVRTVQNLLKHGADVNHEDSWGKSALDVSRQRRFKHVETILRAWQKHSNIVMALVKIRLPDSIATIVVQYWNNHLEYQPVGRRKKSKKGCVIA